jgi:hypothetical protein
LLIPVYIALVCARALAAFHALSFSILFVPPPCPRKKVEALAWVLNHAPLLEDILHRGEIQEGGFRCPSHLAAEFEALLRDTTVAAPAQAALLLASPEPAPDPKVRECTIAATPTRANAPTERPFLKSL